MKVKLTILLVGLIFSNVSCRMDGDPDTGMIKNVNNWEVIFEENFSNSAINTDYWTKIPKYTTDVEWNRYMSPREDLYAVKDGHLTLTGIKNDFATADQRAYLTGGIWSQKKMSIELGKIEVRARIKKVQGAWPAIWLLDEKRAGTTFLGEIDIMESVNFEDKIYQSIHTDLSHSKLKYQTINQIADKSEFNTYGVIINEKEVIFTINGKITGIYKKRPNMEVDPNFPFGPGHKMYVILSMQLNNLKWGGPVNDLALPATMDVDWVRISKKKNPALKDY